MDDDDRVLSCLDDLVEIANRAEPGGLRERAVEPDRVATSNEVPAGEVARRQVVMAGNGDERPAQTPGHVLDEPGLATTRRALQHQRKPASVARFENGNLVARGQIERRLRPRISETVMAPIACRTAKRRWPGARRLAIAHAGEGAVWAPASL